MTNYLQLKNDIERLTPNPRADNIFYLMLKSGYKFFIQELPKTLSDYSKGYLAKDNFKRYKYAISIYKNNLETIKKDFYIYAMRLEYEEAGIKYNIEQELTLSEKAFFIYDSSKSDLLTFIKDRAIKERLSQILEAYLVEVEYFSEGRTLGKYQYFYFNEYLKELKNATEETISDFLLLWESGIISRGARAMWSNEGAFTITDFKDFLLESITDTEERLKKSSSNIADYKRLISLRLGELPKEDLDTYNAIIEKLKHAPGTSYLTKNFQKCFTTKELTALENALGKGINEGSTLLDKLINYFILQNEEEGFLCKIEESLEAYKEILNLYSKGKGDNLESIFLTIFNATSEETSQAIISEEETRIKNADYLANLRSTFPLLSPVRGGKDAEAVENYKASTKKLTEKIAKLELEKQELDSQIRNLNSFSADLDQLSILKEKRNNLEEEIISLRAELRPLTKNIVSIEADYFINKGSIDTYRSERLGFYELYNPGSNAKILLNEEALAGVNDTTQALLLWLIEKITETARNPVILTNEEILEFYRTQKSTYTSHEQENTTQEIQTARSLIYRHLNYIKGMQIQELSSKLTDSQGFINSIKSKKDISLIGTIIRGEGEQRKITIYIDAYFFNAIKQHQGTLRLSPDYKKLPPKARVLYVALEELTYMHSKENGASFNYSYDTLIKWAPNYVDRKKYTGKNPNRLLEAINRDALKIEELGLIRIDHELESLEDSLRGTMLYNLDFYQQRQKDNTEARRKAYLKQERTKQQERLKYLTNKENDKKD